MIMHRSHLNSYCDMWRWGHYFLKTIKKRLRERPSDKKCKRGNTTCKKSFFILFVPPPQPHFPRMGGGGALTTLHVQETVKMKSTKEQILRRKRGRCVTKYCFPILHHVSVNRAFHFPTSTRHNQVLISAKTVRVGKKKGKKHPSPYFWSNLYNLLKIFHIRTVNILMTTVFTK